MTGTFSHDLARSWIVLELLGRAGALGNLQLTIALPCLFLILHGGVVVDRVNVKGLMLSTKGLLGVASLLLAALVELSHIQFWHLLAFGLVEGLILAFDSPAFAALTVRLVPRTDFQQAIALNSTNFHTSRMLGPVVAALLMSWHGPSLVFLFDALTYFFLLFILWRVDLRALDKKPPVIQSGREAMLSGLRYIWHNPSLRYRILQLYLTLCLLFPLMVTVFRSYMQKRFSLNAEQFGYVFTFPAIGSMLGALSFAAVQPKKPIRALMFGIPLAAIMVFLLPLAPNLTVATTAMSILGFCMYLTFASLTVSLQLEVEEEYRGRLSSVIGMGFVSLGPLMSAPIGHIADIVGAPLAIHSLAILFLLGSAALALAYHHRRPSSRQIPS